MLLISRRPRVKVFLPPPAPVYTSLSLPTLTHTQQLLSLAPFPRRVLQHSNPCPGELWGGAPARFIRKLTHDEKDAIKEEAVDISRAAWATRKGE